MSDFLNDLKGIIVTPGSTLGKLMEKKQWIATLILILVFVFVFSYISAPAKMAQSQELLEESQMSEYLSAEELEDFQNMTGSRRIMVALWGTFITFLVLVVAAFFVYLFYGIGGTEGVYSNYFTIVVNASIIDTVLPLLLGILSILSGIGIAALSNLANLLALAPNTMTYLIVSQIDLFNIWYLVALALGIAVFSKISQKKSLFIAGIYFLFTTALKILFSYLSVKILGI
jgi:hypothetical protein